MRFNIDMNQIFTSDMAEMHPVLAGKLARAKFIKVTAVAAMQQEKRYMRNYLLWLSMDKESLEAVELAARNLKWDGSCDDNRIVGLARDVVGIRQIVIFS